MQLIIAPVGCIRAIYSEEFPIGTLGTHVITRASHVEPDSKGCWHADLSPVHGPILGPFNYRSEALAAEVAWLESHWLSLSH